PNPTQEPLVAARGTGLDWSTLPTSLPDGSFSIQLTSSWALRSSIGVSFTVAETMKVSEPAWSITTIRLEPRARRMPEKSWRLPSDGAPTTCDTITLVVGTFGLLAEAVCAVGSSLGTSGTLTPAATWPGARASTVG